MFNSLYYFEVCPTLKLLKLESFKFCFIQEKGLSKKPNPMEEIE